MFVGWFIGVIWGMGWVDYEFVYVDELLRRLKEGRVGGEGEVVVRFIFVGCGNVCYLIFCSFMWWFIGLCYFMSE